MAVKRPNSKRNLDMAIRRLGSSNEDYVANRTLIANAIVGSLMPGGAVKGGSAMKLRYGDASTRASNDLDAARRTGMDEFKEEFEEALTLGWQGFTGRLVPGRQAKPRGVPAAYVMQPFDVRLSYLGTPWCTVQLELGHNEIGDADEPDMVAPADANRLLASMGFPELGPIATMGLAHQVAQKLHGASSAGSSRAHDLIDLQIIASASDLDLPSVRATCARLFAYRQQQGWPPTITKQEDWDELYEAQRVPGVLPTVDEAVAWANALVRSIDEAIAVPSR